MTREEAIDILMSANVWNDEERTAWEVLIPELAESEDEKIRKLLVWQVYRNIEDETNDLAQSVYDGIKGHDPDIEESIEDWKRCLAWLEKQKEQKPGWSEEDEKMLTDISWAIRHCAYDDKKKERVMKWFNDNYRKSLRPQYHGDVTMTEAYKMGLEAGKASSWKPSEEQMEALEYVISDYREDGCNATANYLQEILDHLKNM